LSPDRLRRVLKKRGSFGNDPEKATKENKTQKNESGDLKSQVEAYKNYTGYYYEL